jgi:hypothetical protein
MLPANSTSPVSRVDVTPSGASAGTPARANITDPSVCPGAWTTSIGRPASSNRVASANVTMSSGSAQVAARPNCCSRAASRAGITVASGSRNR